MAKIDCSVTVNYFRERCRMCDFYFGKECINECPLSTKNNGTDLLCTMIANKHPETAVKVVQKWSDEHPAKTRLDDIKERCPNVPLDGEGFPCFKPVMLGYCGDCDRCRNWKKPDTRNCWNEPVDGGATGKAVE